MQNIFQARAVRVLLRVVALLNMQGHWRRSNAVALSVIMFAEQQSTERYKEKR